MLRSLPLGLAIAILLPTIGAADDSQTSRVPFFACSDSIRFSKLDVPEASGVDVYYERDSRAAARVVLKAALAARADLENYFQTRLDGPVNVFVIHSQRSLVRFTGNVRPGWDGEVVAPEEFVVRDLLNGSGPRSTRAEFERLIFHEMVHVFTMQLRGFNSRQCVNSAFADTGWSWLDEGMATYLSGQLEDFKSDLKVYDFKKYGTFADTALHDYGAAATAFEFLLRRLGKDRLIDLMRHLPNTGDSLAIRAAIQERLGGEMTVRSLERDWIEFVREKYLHRR